MCSDGPTVPDIQHLRCKADQTSVGPAQEGENCVTPFYSATAIQGLSAASLAQLAARQSHNLKVVSSSLTGGTFFIFSPTINH